MSWSQDGIKVMLLCLLILTILRQLSCESKSSHEDAQIETLLLQLLYESTETSPPTSPRPLAFFDAPSNINLTTQLGAAVVFHCRVNGLVDEALVSWLRRGHSQLHLLSVGVEVYSTDSRLTATFVAPNDWQLRLSGAQARDQGLYECQVSSHPPVILTVHLHVVVPEIQIADERGFPIRNKFYNAGSTIELKCVISTLPQATSISWAHGTQTLNHTSRLGVSVKTDLAGAGAVSRLFLANARTSDSGNYSCGISDLVATSVAVHVLDAFLCLGETPAAMQHGGDNGGPFPKPWTILCLITIYHFTLAR